MWAERRSPLIRSTAVITQWLLVLAETMVSISPCQSSHHLPRTPERGWCISLCSIITWSYICISLLLFSSISGITFLFGGDDRWYLDSTVWGICRLYLLIVVLIAHLTIVQIFVRVSLWEDFFGILMISCKAKEDVLLKMISRMNTSSWNSS